MIKLQKFNVVKLVAEEDEAKVWECKGFTRVVDVEPTDTGDNLDLNKPVGEMTVPELKAYAKLKEIDLDGATKKEDVLAAIQGAEANVAEA